VKTSAKALTVGLAIVGTSLTALSSQDDDHNFEMVNQASLSAGQAIAIALNAVSGKVIEAEIEKEDGKLVWEVEVLTSENEVYELEIDANDGRIIETEREDS